MLLENLFPPIPSEVVMPLAGYFVAQGQLTAVGAVLAGLAGSLAGALVLYALGRRVGAERLDAFAERHGEWLALRPRDLQRARRWFDRHGRLAVFVCRLVPGVRSLISIPAGICNMPVVPFLLWSAAGTLLWTGGVVGVGWWLGDSFHVVGRWLGRASWAVVGLMIAAYLLQIVRRRRGRRNARRRREHGAA